MSVYYDHDHSLIIPAQPSSPKSDVSNKEFFSVHRFPTTAMMSLSRSTSHHKFPKNMKDTKKGSGNNRFDKVSDANGKEKAKSHSNLHPHPTASIGDVFNKCRNEHHFLVSNEDGNRKICRSTEHLCKIILRKKSSNEKIRDADLLFQAGAVANGLIFLQFPHVDDAGFSCHVGCNLEGLYSMLHKIIDGKLCCEKVHLPFGCILILTDEACHGGRIGSHGSFRFHFSLKDRCGLGIERLTSDKDYLKKSFYEAFPAIGDSLDRLVNPSIETLTNEHETHMCDESETSEHISNLTNALHENIIFDCCSCLK